MRSVVSLYATRDRFVVLVEMNAHKDAVSRAIPEGSAISQGDIGVSEARHQRGDPFGIQQPIDPARNIQRQIFFHHAPTHGAGVLTAMAWIENDHREWFGRRWLVGFRLCSNRRPLFL